MRKFLLLLSFMCLHIGMKVRAQATLSGNLAIRADSSGANWKILTDAKSRRTRVQFFAGDQTLLYEEELPEKWIKQNKRNRHRLDRLLADITANKLIVSRLRSEELPAEPVKLAIAATLENEALPNEGNSYKIHVAINSEGKILVAVDNPENLRYKIEIADYSNKVVYQEFTSLNQYRRHIDISPVISQAAQLIFLFEKKRLVYNIAREERKSSYTITPVVAQL